MQKMLNSVKLTFLGHSVGPKIVMKLGSLSLPLTQLCLPTGPWQLYMSKFGICQKLI